MKCPVCSDVELVMTERQGVEIDYCPRCRGVWLDRGELDKIIDRSASSYTDYKREAQEAPRQQPRSRDENYHYSRDDDHSRSRDEEHYRKKKRRGFLGDLFDFD